MISSSSDGAHLATGSLSVLLADNDVASRQSLAGWLRELGHHVILVSSGAEALREMHHRMLDLVITEVLLPDADGIEVINALRKTQPAARVVAFSAGGRYLSAAECLRVAKGLGANAVLRKPATREQLIGAVAQAMQKLESANPFLMGTDPVALRQIG